MKLLHVITVNHVNQCEFSLKLLAYNNSQKHTNDVVCIGAYGQADVEGTVWLRRFVRLPRARIGRSCVDNRVPWSVDSTAVHGHA